MPFCRTQLQVLKRDAERAQLKRPLQAIAFPIAFTVMQGASFQRKRINPPKNPTPRYLTKYI